MYWHKKYVQLEIYISLYCIYKIMRNTIIILCIKIWAILRLYNNIQLIK